MNHNFKKYIIFWLSQSVSQLGSSLTGFALIIWAYTIDHSALTISLMSFCNYVPYIIVSLFAGGFVDGHSKKKIMLVSDSMAAVCSLCVLIFSFLGVLQIWHIYVVNGVIGFMNAFQSPASAVAIARIVPEEKLTNVSGMNSFSTNLISVLTPVIAASLFSFGGLKVILMIDLLSFVAAFLVLLFVLSIPEYKSLDGNGEPEHTEDGRENRFQSSKKNRHGKRMFAGCRQGYVFLVQNRGIFLVVLTMALLNFFSRLTYENILSPMLLARSGNDSLVLGIVNAVMGIGGVVGGIIVSAGKFSKDHVKMIYVSAGISFLFGDLLMGIGKNVLLWSMAGLAASLPIPFINAGQNVILYQKVPDEMQGRVFAVRNAIQYATVPAGILLGGFLADHVFEPYMRVGNPVTSFLHILVGDGAGSGMAVMFLGTGICGCVFSYVSYRKKEIQELR